MFDALERIRRTRQLTVVMPNRIPNISHAGPIGAVSGQWRVVRNGDARMFTNERAMLESAGVEVAADPLPRIVAMLEAAAGEPVIAMEHVTHLRHTGRRQRFRSA